MARRPSKAAVRSSELIAKHRSRAFVITAIGILVIADSGRRAVSVDDSQLSELTWMVVGLMALSVIATLLALRFVQPSVRLGVVWALGVTPFIYGFAALMSGSPIAFMWLGMIVSICLIAWAAFVIKW
jgi:membrane protein CcdC involved in cytochrome C biogenesis